MIKREVFQVLEENKEYVIRLLSAKTAAGTPAIGYIDILKAVNIEVTNTARHALSDFAIKYDLRRHKRQPGYKGMILPLQEQTAPAIIPAEQDVLNALRVIKRFLTE